MTSTAQPTQYVVASTPGPTNRDEQRILPLWTRATTTFGVVEIRRDNFGTLIDTTVKNQLYIGPPRPAIFKSDTGVFKMFAFVGACDLPNLARMGVRHDLYLAAQEALRSLMHPSVSPTSWPWELYVAKSEYRTHVASTAADWLTQVHNWVSLALCAANVQPGMLFPANQQTVGTTGEYLPSSRYFPTPVETAINNLRTQGGANGISLANARNLGPMWMGFYDDDGPTGWLDCNFAPQMDPVGASLNNSRYKIGGLENGYPGEWSLNVPTSIANDPKHKGMARLTTASKDPWFLWFYNFLQSTDPMNEWVTSWRIIPEQARDAPYSRYVVGPRASLELALGWAKAIVDSTVFDIVRPSYAWYTANHMVYWQAKGVLDYSVSEINTIQRQTAAAIVEGKGAAAMSAINSTAAAAMAVPNPIVQGVAAGVALVGSLITMGVVARRKKKAANESKKPQPLTLRTMTDVACATFGPTLKLPTGLEEAARQLQDGDIRAAQTGVAPIGTSTVTSVAPSPNTGTSTTNAANTAPGAATAPPMPSEAQVLTAATAATNQALQQAASSGALPSAQPPSSSAVARADGIPTPIVVGLGIAAAIGIAAVARR